MTESSHIFQKYIQESYIIHKSTAYSKSNSSCISTKRLNRKTGNNVQPIRVRIRVIHISWVRLQSLKLLTDQTSFRFLQFHSFHDRMIQHIFLVIKASDQIWINMNSISQHQVIRSDSSRQTRADQRLDWSSQLTLQRRSLSSCFLSSSVVSSHLQPPRSQSPPSLSSHSSFFITFCPRVLSRLPLPLSSATLPSSLSSSVHSVLLLSGNFTFVTSTLWVRCLNNFHMKSGSPLKLINIRETEKHKISQ